MVYFIGDLHFGHANIIRLCNRPFVDSDEMDEALIKNWNDKVKKDDDVYILGDFCYKSKNSPDYYLKRLNGRKHLIVGNHDYYFLENKAVTCLFSSIKPLNQINIGKKQVVLCHYPILEWNGYYRGSYHIYGHVHNSTKNKAYEWLKNEPMALNAGADINHMTPVSLDELIANNAAFFGRAK